MNPPADGFAEILNYKKYIDKSGMLAYTNRVLGTPDKLICFSRPRRFGKSFAAKMVTAYYSKGADASALFAGLKIAKMDADPNSKERPGYEDHLNKHDVISIDMTPFVSLAESTDKIVSNLQIDLIEELEHEFPGCIKKGTKTLYKALLQVNMTTGRKFFIVIDEWDMIFREAKDNILVQKEYLNLLRSLFKSNQTSQMIIGAYITGILPFKKYGTQSALTDFREFTMLKPGPLAEFVGFTENEVRELCREYHLDFEETRKWYDGYRFESIGHVYCPNSIMELISAKAFDNYWTTTETYESLRDYIDLNLDGLKDAVIEMLGGKRCRIDTGTFQNDMTSLASRDDIFTLLVHLGYLAYDFANKEVFIPNEEVRGEFVRAVKESRRSELAKAVKMSDKLLDATLRCDEDTVARMIQSIHMSETTLQNYNDEQALRYVILTAYLSSIDHYLRFEELANGRGYSDILFLPRKSSSKPALLIELKWNKSADQAISQIKEKQYTEFIRKFDYDGNLLLIGLNYDTKSGKHTCRIERYQGRDL